MKIAFSIARIGTIAGCLLACGLEAHAQSARVNASTGILKKDDARFLELHQAFLNRAKEGPIGLLFIGDSITEGWSGHGARVWSEAFGDYTPANFGIGGDMTQHLIWRIEQGELDNVEPRTVVVLIGTNNSAANTSAEIIEAISKIMRLIQEKLPRAQLVLMGIFPRGPRINRDGKPDGWENRMHTIQAVNATLKKMPGKNLHFLDISDRFISSENKITERLMPDQLHLSEDGYRVWSESLKPLLGATMSDVTVRK